MQKLAHLLDSSIRLPGGYRIGMDGIVGLVPVLGEAVGASLSYYIIFQASKLGASTLTLSRMMLNVLVETVVGVVPVVGDIFDFAWKANERNMKILNRQLERQPASSSVRRRLTLASVILLLLFFAVLVATILLAFKVFIVLVMWASP